MGFNEFQTPILTSSSPEGARDYLVPSRHYPGKFFALPQAPQQFKQLIMVSGFDRYFQIAPCFRDEDPRADRSPGEFYQLDIEMSFVEQDDVFEIGEAIFTPLFSKFTDCEVDPGPYRRIPYKQVLEQYGTDKPDLRNPLLIEDVGDVFASSEFRVFQSALAAGGGVRAIATNLPELPSRKYFDDTIAWFQDISGQGLAYLAYDGEVVKGSIAKFVSESEKSALRAKCASKGPCVFFIAAGETSSLLQ